MAAYVVTLGVTYGGFNNGMMRYKDDREGYTTSVMGLVLAMGAFWLLLGTVFSEQASVLTGMPLVLVALMFCETVSKAIYEIWTSRMRFDFEYKKLVAVSVLQTVLVPAVGVAFVVMASDKVLARVLGFVVVESVFGILLAGAMLKKSRRIFCAKYWKYTLLFNIPLLPHYLSQVLLSSADRIIIGDMCSPADAGIYSIAYSAGMVMMLLVSSLNATVNPWLYRKMDAKEYDRVNKIGVAILVMLAAAILIMDGFAPTIVAILAPGEYSDAMYLVPVVAASVFFIYLYLFCSNIEFFYERTSVAMVASVIAAVLNVVLNLIFIPRFGYAAAGYVTLACYVVLGVTHFLFAQRVAIERAGRPILNGRFIGLLSVGMLIASIAFSAIYPYPIARYLVTLAIVVVGVWKRKVIIEKAKEVLS